MKHFPYRTWDYLTPDGTLEATLIEDADMVRVLHKAVASHFGVKPDNHEAFVLDDGTIFYFTDLTLQIYGV